MVTTKKNICETFLTSFFLSSLAVFQWFVYACRVIPRNHTGGVLAFNEYSPYPQRFCRCHPQYLFANALAVQSYHLTLALFHYCLKYFPLAPFHAWKPSCCQGYITPWFEIRLSGLFLPPSCLQLCRITATADMKE